MIEFTELINAANLANAILDNSKNIVLFRNICLDLTGSLDIVNALYLIKDKCDVYSMCYGIKNTKLNSVYNLEYLKFIESLDTSILFSSNLETQQLIYLAIDEYTNFNIFNDNELEHIVAMKPLIIKKDSIQLPEIFNIGYKSMCNYNNWEILKTKRVYRNRK